MVESNAFGGRTHFRRIIRIETHESGLSRQSIHCYTVSAYICMIHSHQKIAGILNMSVTAASRYSWSFCCGCSSSLNPRAYRRVRLALLPFSEAYSYQAAVSDIPHETCLLLSTGMLVVGRLDHEISARNLWDA